MKRQGPGTNIDELFQIPLAEFTTERNALAARLKKAGDEDGAGQVKRLAKPSISAWVVNQLYWQHRTSFDRLLAAGDRFREAQAAQLAGKSADLRAPLEARRDALAELSKLAAAVLRNAGHPAAPDVMRRVTTTLEAVATYGGHADAPPAGRLTADVDPPGFEALAALVPRAGDGGSRGSASPRVIPFTQARRESPSKRKPATEDDVRRLEAERRAKHARAKKALHDAERSLSEAKRTAEKARDGMKVAATRAKDAEKAKAMLETQLEKASADAADARQRARRIASQAEEAAQAMDDAERAVVKARAELKDSRS